MAKNDSYLAICEGDDGIPLWNKHPTIENIPTNTVAAWLEPYVTCVVVLDYDDQTSMIIHDGIICFAVTACLFKI